MRVQHLGNHRTKPMAGCGGRKMNLPPNWNNYYYNCTRCGHRCHESESDCSHCNDMTDKEVQDEKTKREEAELAKAELKQERDWSGFWPV
jgi:hypothetical protein